MCGAKEYHDEDYIGKLQHAPLETTDKRMLNVKKMKAFTLVELLVVIAIIALLMAVLMPALQRAREQGKRAVCMSNLKQLNFAWLFYADDNDDRLVNGCTNQGNHNKFEPCWLYFRNEWNDEQRLKGVLDGTLFEYVKNIKLYKCPTGIRGAVNTYAIVDSMNGKYLILSFIVCCIAKYTGSNCIFSAVWLIL